MTSIEEGLLEAVGIIIIVSLAVCGFVDIVKRLYGWLYNLPAVEPTNYKDTSVVTEYTMMGVSNLNKGTCKVCGEVHNLTPRSADHGWVHYLVSYGVDVNLIKYKCDGCKLDVNFRWVESVEVPIPSVDKPKTPPKKLKAGECVACGNIHDKRDRGEDTAYGELFKENWGNIHYTKFNCDNCYHHLNFEWSDFLDVPEVVPRTIDPSNIRIVYRKTSEGIRMEYREVISSSSDLHNTEIQTVPCTSEDTYPYEES